MDYNKILSISGKSGLFRLISTSKGRGVVESLIDGKRIPTFTTDRVSSVEDISVYIVGDNIPLKSVLKTIFEKEEGKAILDSKSPEKELKEYFTTILPTWDTERVYISDIRKIISWYNFLQERNLLEFDDEPIENEATNEDGTDKPKSDASKDKVSGKSARNTSNASNAASKNVAASTKAKSKQTVMKKTTPQSKAK